MLTIAALGFGSLPQALAQSMEPLSYSNAPIGLNFLIVGRHPPNGQRAGRPDLAGQGCRRPRSIPPRSPTCHVFDFWGQSGSLAFVVPNAWLTASGEVFDQARSISRNGLADITLRLSVNLLGAPALTLQEFASYQQDTIVGVTLLVTAPTGQYDPSKLVNIGTNRWSFKPEVGVSKALGPWTLEAAAGVTFFTDNDQFFGNGVRQQDPLYSVQGHAIYNFNPRLVGCAGRHLLHRRPHDLEWQAGRRSAEQHTLGRHAGVFARPHELDQGLLQFRGVRAHRNRLPDRRSRVAGSLGGGAVKCAGR